MVVVLFYNSQYKTWTSQSDPIKLFEASLQNPSVQKRAAFMKKKACNDNSGSLWFTAMYCWNHREQRESFFFTLLIPPLIWFTTWKASGLKKLWHWGLRSSITRPASWLWNVIRSHSEFINQMYKQALMWR